MKRVAFMLALLAAGQACAFDMTPTDRCRPRSGAPCADADLKGVDW